MGAARQPSPSAGMGRARPLAQPLPSGQRSRSRALQERALAAALLGAAVGALAAPPPATAELAPARRLGTPSVQAAGDIQRIKQALQQLALDHPEVQSAQAAAATSGFEVEAARLARYPRFKLGSAAGSYNSGADGAATQNYQLITAEARMSLLDGGAMHARVRAAEAGSLAQDEALRSTSQKVVLDAITAYLQVQRFDLQRELAAHATRVVDELARAEQRRVALGATGQNDLRMAAARRAGTAARESDFDARRSEALAKFQSYFGFEPEPRRLPALATPEGWIIDALAEALRRAEARSTELAEGRSRVERAEALVTQHEASLWPTVDAVLVKSKDPRGVSPSEPTRAALELTWNFGSGFDRQLRVKSALAEVENQRARLESARRGLSEAASAAWSHTRAGRERERQLHDAVRESGEAFRGRRRLLEFGRETLPSVLDAQLDYYTLLQDYIDAVFDRRISEFRLARATGELRVAPDAHTPWVDRIFGPPAGPLLDQEGVLGLDCPGAGRGPSCSPGSSSAPAPAGPPGGDAAPLALRAAMRLRGR